MKEKEKVVALHGSYFGRNFGDTLILWIIKTWIEEANQDFKVVLPFVNSKLEAFEILEKENGKEKLEDADALIFGPGGYFGEPPWGFLRKLRWTFRNYKRHLKWNRILYKNKIPYAIIGVGVGPLSFGFMRRKVVKLFKNAAIISVRDKYSKQYLIDWGIETSKIQVVSDVALTLSPKKDVNTKVSTRETVGIHLNNLSKYTVDKQEAIIDFVIDLDNSHDLFLIEDVRNQVDFNKEGNVGYILKSKGLTPKVLKYERPSKLIENLSSFNYLITSKLHVGIVGYATGIPVLSIPFHSKTIRFYEQIKRDRFCMYNRDFNKDLLLSLFSELKENPVDSNLMHVDALRNKEILLKFLAENIK